LNRNRAGNIQTKVWAGHLRNHGLISGRDRRYFCSAKHPDQFRHPSLLFSGYQGFFCLGGGRRVMMLTTHLHHQVTVFIKLYGVYFMSHHKSISKTSVSLFTEMYEV